MIEIFGEYYYIDFDALDKFTKSAKELKYSTTREVYDADTKNMRIEEITNTTESSDSEINPVRYEIARNFIDDLLSGTNSEDYDDKLASKNLDKTEIRFKLAYNTLSYYKILRKLD